jgi:spore germination protein GerM
MGRKRVATLGFLFVVLMILVAIFFLSGIKEKIIPAVPTSPPEVEPLPMQPGQTRSVVLFFLSEEDTLLHPEQREIPADLSVVRQAKQTIEELIKGSQKGYISPFPPEAKLRELYVTEEGVAYVDFSKDIVEKHLSGSSAEISTIFSVVNSLAYNFDDIEKVFILIEGRERETLGGHINLSRPFLPLYDLIAQ